VEKNQHLDKIARIFWNNHLRAISSPGLALGLSPEWHHHLLFVHGLSPIYITLGGFIPMTAYENWALILP
jgi:hypothetical protein